MCFLFLRHCSLPTHSTRIRFLLFIADDTHTRRRDVGAGQVGSIEAIIARRVENSGNLFKEVNMLEYEITARRIDEHGSVVLCKEAELTIDTDVNGRTDALNPAELLLASVAACILKNIERIAPMTHFAYRGVTVRVHGVRQDSPPKMLSINYEIIIDSDENDRKLELMHENIRKYGTVYNTVAPGTDLQGILRRSGGAT